MVAGALAAILNHEFRVHTQKQKHLGDLMTSGVTYLRGGGKNLSCRDFPGSAVVKNLPVDAGDRGLISGPGRSHMPQSN